MRWKGSPRELTFHVARKVREVLLSDTTPDRWSKRATDAITNRREEMGETARMMGHIFSDAGQDRVRWVTFAGAQVNQLLAALLMSELDVEVNWNDFELSIPAHVSPAKIEETFRHLVADGHLLNKLPVSKELVDQLKFSECLPEPLAQEAILSRCDVTPITKENLLATPGLNDSISSPEG